MIRYQQAQRKLRRQLFVETLEQRQLLAVDGFRIDLSGSGDVDLFDPNGGGTVQQGYVDGIGGGGSSIGTSNVPGVNNQNPIAGDDSDVANEDGPAITINVADLLVNDSDPDDSGTLSIIAVSNTGTLGLVSFDSLTGTITYDPNGAFEQLADGQTAIDTFYYSLDDSKNGHSTGTVIVTITGANDAPTISGAATATATEGSTATHTGTFADVDSGDTITLTASEGNVTDNLDGTWSWSLATTDDAAMRAITITATDAMAASNDVTFQFTVTNVAPTIALTGSGSAVEGILYELTLGSVTDPGDDTVTGYTIDWGDGTPLETPGTAGLKTHTYADGPNDYTVTVSVIDEDGTHTAGTHSVTVSNAAPIVAADNSSVTVNEGVTANNTGAFSDGGDDTVTLSASVGTITDNLNGTWSWSFDSTDGPTESQTVTITATDSDSVATTTTFGLIVNNVAPIVAANNATVTVDEGQTATNTGTYSDASGDTVTLTADFGTITDNNDGTWSWSYDSTDGPDESQTVTITATDNDTAATTATFALVVNNVAPVAAAQTINALGNVPLSRAWSTLLAGATDVGDDVLSVESIDSTTGVGTLTFDNVAETFRYVPQTGFEGTTTFLFTIADSDGATHQQTATISIDQSLWVVDNSAAPGGDGSLALPFQNFTALNNVETDPDADASGDIIFVVGTVTPYDVTYGVHNDGGFHLEDDQVFIGSGLAGTTLEAYLAGIDITVPAGSDALPAINAISPTITNTTGDVLTVATGNTIGGVTLDPVASAGIAGDNAGDLVIEFTIIVTSGGTNDNEGIRLRNVTGTITIKSTDIGSADGQTNAGTAIQIDGGTASFQFDDLDIDQDGGSLLEILNTAASTIAFDENSELTLQGSDEAAVTITGNNGGTVKLNNAGFNADTTATVKFNITGNTGLKATTPVNDAPEFILPSLVHTTLEDGGPQSITAFATDVTPGPDPTESDQVVAFTILSNDNEAIFAVLPQLDATGNLTYTLADGALGTANITVNLSDDGGTTDGGMDTSETQTFTIEVVPVNDAPSFTISADPASVPEDSGTQTLSSFATNLSPGPADESGQTLTFEVTGNTNANLFAVPPTINSAGELTYTPADDLTGTATITVVLHDDGGTDHGGVDTSPSQTFVITVAPPVNDAPSFTLEHTTVTVDEDAGTQTVTGFASELSTGPADESSQTLTFEITNNSNAALFATAPTIDANGNLTFTSADNAHGTATMLVTLRDNGGTDNTGIDASPSQTITITVDPVNDSPVLATLSNQTVDELQTLRFAATATDEETASDELTFSLEGDQHFGASMTSDGEFSWTPTEAHGAGTFVFDVIVSDGDTDDRQSITVTVNEVNTAPVLDSIDDHSIDEGSQLHFTATATDADLPANTLAFSLGSNAAAGAAITQSGEFTWTPTESQGPGSYTFDIVVTDGDLTATETITVTVADVNNSPVLTTIPDQTGNEHELISFTATATDSDLPSDTLTFSLDGNVPAGAAITSGGVFTWTPSEDQQGTFVFNVVVSDGQANDYETITWTIAEVNDAPVLDAIGDQAGNEHELLSFTATATDSDLPSDTQTFSLDGNVPDGAAITTDGEFSWTPSEDQQGVFTFNVVVSDGQANDYETITWTIAEVNDPPILDAIGDQTLSEGQLHTFNAISGDPDRPFQDLTFSLTGNVPDGAAITTDGEFSWTPNEDQQGVFTFDVVVSDGQANDYETITWTIAEVNDPPVLDAIGDHSGNEHDLLSFTATATDGDLPFDTLTFSLTGNVPDGAAITSGGEFSWTPSEDQQGAFTFNVVVSDGQANDYETITWTIAEVNDPPVLDAIGDQTSNENELLSFTAAATDSDLPSDTLTFSLDGNVPDGAAITTGGEFSWTPSEDQQGVFTFNVVVSDGQANDYETITWTIAEVNDPPVLDAIGHHSVDEGQLLTFAVTATDADLPADTLSFSLSQNAPDSAHISSASVFEWTPSETDGGSSFTFDVIVNDGTTTDSENITITVNDASQPILADVILEIGKADINGQVVYLSYFDLNASGSNHTDATRIDLKRVDDTEFMRPDVDGEHQAAGFHYTSFSEFMDAHDGIHEFGIDHDGDGAYEETFTIDVNLEGFTADSFPSYPVVASPSGEIDDTTPTIAWNEISGAESIYVSANLVEGAGIENLDEIWWAQPQLAGTATSVTTDSLPTDQPLLASVQANFRRDDLAITASTDGLVNLSFFTNSIGTSSFTIAIQDDLAVLIDDDFSNGTGGVPESWTVLENGGSIVEAGSSLTMLAGATDDDWTTIAYPETAIDLPGGPATFSVTLDSLSAGANTYVGFIELESSAGVGLDFHSDGQIKLSSPDDDSYYSGLQLSGYDSTQPVELTLSIESSGVQIRAKQGDNELDSGLIPNSQLNGFNVAAFTNSVYAILAVGNPNAIVVIDEVEVRGTEASVEPAETAAIADIEFGFVQGEFSGESFIAFNIEIDTLDDRADYQTVLYVTTPMDSEPRVHGMGGGDEWIGIDAEEDQSLTDFVALLDGNFLFEFDFDGDDSIDETITIQLDTAAIIASMFPAAISPTTPADGAVLTADNRELTITLPEHPTADEVFVEVGNGDLDVWFFETNFEGAASLTTPALPTGLELNIIAAPSHQLPSRVEQTGGSDVANVTFGLSTLSVTTIEIDDHVKAISPAEPSGAFGGGNDAVGGVDFVVEGLANQANFKFEYQVFTGAEWQYVAYGDFDATLDLRSTVQQPSGFDVVQSWEFIVDDAAGNAVAFDHADLSLKYDATLLGNDWNTTSEIANHLVAYQFDGSSWQTLETLARRPSDSELDIRATAAGSHIVLGYDMSASQVDWHPNHLAGEAEMEVYRVEMDGGDDFYLNNIEFSAYGPNITGASTISVTRPGGGVESDNEEAAHVFLEHQFDTLAELIAANNGTYTVDVDYEDDGTIDRQFTVTFNISDLLDASLPDAPVVTSPTPGATISASDPNLEISWEPQLSVDGIFGFVQIENAPGQGDNEEIAEQTVSSTATRIVVEDVPTDERLFIGVGASETQHHRSSSTSSNGTIQTKVELITLSTLNVGTSDLRAATTANNHVCHAVLTTDQLQPIVDEAISRLAATGISDAQIEQIENTRIEITDLDGNLLGSTTEDAIQIDVNAANHGWFVDPTPAVDEVDEVPDDHIDLLTTILHEFNHILGKDHNHAVDDLMNTVLSTGKRRLPDTDESSNSSAHVFDAALTDWISER
ncbi:putative Ig domain protein [Novipirellula galeiformis]|uniref:Putative Ig domain protein n=1 Tax=Novipirellula galeiformis TaxID=2528004 RepID=A0A5C6CWK7_9BACT|nr:Ig-like domain-containing protein [Novipirellula galeiformis]TWU27019.1 putative Ig domain protein [Novipirellula galeiformis]